MDNELLESKIEIQRGEWSDNQEVTFAELASDWLELDVGPRAKESTIGRYEGRLRVHLLPEFGGWPASEVTLVVLQAYAVRSIEGGLAVNTVKETVSTARAVLRAGVQWGRLKQDPAAGRMRYPQVARKEIQPLTGDEVRELIEAAPDKYRALLVFALGTGMRVGEILAAKWCNLDLDGEDGAVYHVRENLSRERKFTTPKTASSMAPVSLPPPVVAALKAHKARWAGARLKKGEGYVDQDLIFCTGKGTAYAYPHVVRRILDRSLELAGLRKITFHELRHTCASTMIAEGARELEVMKQLRHASIQQTMNVYGHLFPKKTAETMKRLGEALFGGLDF